MDDRFGIAGHVRVIGQRRKDAGLSGARCTVAAGAIGGIDRGRRPLRRERRPVRAGSRHRRGRGLGDAAAGDAVEHLLRLNVDLTDDAQEDRAEHGECGQSEHPRAARQSAGTGCGR